MHATLENKDNKVFNILKTFSRKDLRLFSRFIRSPYFNKHDEVTAFYQYLVGFHPDYRHLNLKKEYLHKKLFRGEKYNDKKIRYLFTDLARLLEKYLVNEQLDLDDELYHTTLLQSHVSRNNQSEFIRNYNSNIKRNQDQMNDTTYSYHLFAKGEMYINYFSPRQSRKENSMIEDVIRQLDLFYIAKKLELSCETENVQALLEKKFEPFLLDEILKKLETHPYAKEPIIAVYLGILRTLRQPDDEKSFEQLLRQLQKDEKTISKDRLREFYQYILNFCIKKINSGRTEYQDKIFNIYKIILGNGVLMPLGVLSQWDYKNIVTVSLRLKNFQWAKSFIEEYQKYLHEAERENSFTYNLANYYFHKKNYTSALKLLQMIEFSDPVYQLDARAMLLKIYTEQDDQDTLFYHFKAFGTFLQRNRHISRFHKLLYGNLIRYTKKFVQAGGNRIKLKAIDNTLDEVTQVADIQWLKNMIAELI